MCPFVGSTPPTQSSVFVSRRVLFFWFKNKVAFYPIAMMQGELDFTVHWPVVCVSHSSTWVTQRKWIRTKRPQCLPDCLGAPACTRVRESVLFLPSQMRLLAEPPPACGPDSTAWLDKRQGHAERSHKHIHKHIHLFCFHSLSKMKLQLLLESININ